VAVEDHARGARCHFLAATGDRFGCGDPGGDGAVDPGVLANGPEGHDLMQEALMQQA
jgi:hypothetical protein